MTSRAQTRQGRAAQMLRNREARWEANRFSVPYRTDNPTVSLSVLWFLALLAGNFFWYPIAVLAVVVVAGIAGLQTGHAWARYLPSDRRVSAALSGVIAIAGAFGRLPLGLAVVLCTLAALIYVGFGMAVPQSRQIDTIALAEIAIRSSVPAGLAAGAILALGSVDRVAAVALIALVSAYEAGDYLVGTGSDNAYEGPVAGAVTLAVIGVGFWLLQPEPFDATSAMLFALLTAIACPTGQILGSTILPRGSAWAPGLRRLDSYLVSAPLWLLMLKLIEG